MGNQQPSNPLDANLKIPEKYQSKEKNVWNEIRLNFPSKNDPFTLIQEDERIDEQFQELVDYQTIYNNLFKEYSEYDETQKIVIRIYVKQNVSKRRKKKTRKKKKNLYFMFFFCIIFNLI